MCARCESCSVALSSVDFTDGAEKSKIHVFIEESVKRLHGSDRLLPQVLQLRGLLMRGIGVHHGGLLPIMKVPARAVSSLCVAHSPPRVVVHVTRRWWRSCFHEAW